MVTCSNPKGLSCPLVPIKTMPKQSVFSSYNFLCTHSEANVKAESLKPKTKKVVILDYWFNCLNCYLMNLKLDRHRERYKWHHAEIDNTEFWILLEYFLKYLQFCFLVAFLQLRILSIFQTFLTFLFCFSQVYSWIFARNWDRIKLQVLRHLIYYSILLHF